MVLGPRPFGGIMNKREEVVFISFIEAEELVERIADRTVNFNHTMTEPEKTAMAQLLSDVGVKVSDLINVDRLADEYAINAEIVGPDEVKDYDRAILNDALYSWDDEDGKHYVISW